MNFFEKEDIKCNMNKSFGMITINKRRRNTIKAKCIAVGLGGLEVTCSPRDQRFASSNPAEVDDFFQDLRILSANPPGGTLSWGSAV